MAGDGGVAIDNNLAVRHDGGIELCAELRGACSEDSEEESADPAMQGVAAGCTRGMGHGASTLTRPWAVASSGLLSLWP